MSEQACRFLAHCDACNKVTMQQAVPVLARNTLDSIDVECLSCGREEHYIDVAMVKR